MRLIQMALLFVVTTASCVSPPKYQPAKSPRIVNDGRGGYVRDGTRYFNLVEAVHGNPRAEAEARAAEKGEKTALILGVTGLSLEFSGLAVLGIGGHEHKPAVSLIGLGMIVAGLASSIAFYPVLGHAAPHRIDAVNIYNDGAVTCPVAPAPTATSRPSPGSAVAP
jgi:hypothetical protein